MKGIRESKLRAEARQLTDYLPSVDGGEERKAGTASALHTKSNADRHFGFDLDRGVAYLIRNSIMVCDLGRVKMLMP